MGREVIGKKGLSTVVTTVIMVLLVLVAVGVVWVVINNILGDTSGQIDISAKCSTTNLEVDSVICQSATECTVALKKSGSHEINGTLFVFSNATASSNPDVPPQVGDIQVLKSFTLNPNVASPTKVSVKAYFINNEGVDVPCSQITERNI